MNVTFSSWDHGFGESGPPCDSSQLTTWYIIVRLELPPATTCAVSTPSRSANTSRISVRPSSPP